MTTVSMVTGACGRGRCYNLDGRSGFRCLCPLGKTGSGCLAGKYTWCQKSLLLVFMSEKLNTLLRGPKGRLDLYYFGQ